MGKHQSELRTDVEKLVKDSTVEEAGCEVWKKFERAISRLSPESQEWLDAHFDGISVAELSRRTKLDPSEVEECLARAKRQLIHYLRTETRLRQ